MALIVQAHDRVQSQVLTPLSAMNMVSTALARTSGLQLTGITWALEEIPFVPDANAKGNARLPPKTLSDLPPGSELVGAILKQNTRIKIVITGESSSDTSFRQAQDQVTALVESLQEFPGITATATQMPTDIRTDISLSTTVDDREVRAPFTLEVFQDIEFPTAAQVAVQP